MKPIQIAGYFLLLGLLFNFISCDSLSALDSNDHPNRINSQVAPNSPSLQTLTDGLVAHWTFDEMEGAIIGDASVNGFDGTNYGAIWSTGPMNGALTFDGIDDRVFIPSEGTPPPEEIGGLTKGSLCMWFKYADFNSDTTQVVPVFYLGRDEGPYSGLIVEIGHDNNPTEPNRRLYFTIVDLADPLGETPSQCFDSNFDLDPDTWYHFCAIVSETGNTGFLDGLEMTDRRYNLGSDETFTEFFASVSVQEVLSFGYGKYSKNKKFYDFPGSIDDMRIYDRPLNSDEVWTLYQLADPDANQPPTASFTVQQGADELTFDLDATSSADDGVISQFDWDFGDGQTGSGSIISHTYASAGTYDITLTVTDDEGLTGSVIQTVTIGTNQPPVASFSFSVSDLAVDFTDESNDSDGQIDSWSWSFGDGNSSVSQNPAHTYAEPGTYDVNLTVTDDDGAEHSIMLPVTVDAGSGDEAFLEQDGQVVFEAEHFMSRIDRNSHSWIETTNLTGYSSDGAMLSDPDDGTRIRSDPANESPELSFKVNFSTTGLYYIWARVWAPNNMGSSFHTGLDGAVTASRMTTFIFGSWTWTNEDSRNQSMTMTIDEAGLHDIQLWMLEDGLAIDKVVLSTDAAFTPQDEGPPESPRE